MKVTVTEIKLLQNCSYLLSFLADGAKDAVDNHVSGDDVKFTGSRTGYFVGADFEAFLSKECVEVHESWVVTDVIIAAGRPVALCCVPACRVSLNPAPLPLSLPCGDHVPRPCRRILVATLVAEVNQLLQALR